MTQGPAAELARLVRELRSSPGLATSSGLLRDGLRILDDLSPDERRDVAVRVAARAAPELVPAIRDSKLDMTEDQATTVLALLRRLDPTQLAQLADDLENPERRHEIVESAGRAAASAAAADAGVVAPGPEAGATPEAEPGAVPEPEPGAAPEAEPEAAPEPQRGPEPQPEPEAQPARESKPAPEPEPDPEPDPAAKPEPDAAAEPPRAAAPASEAQPVAEPDPTAGSRGPARSWFTGAALGFAADEEDGSLAADLIALDGTYRRLRELQHRFEELWELPAAEQRAVLRAIPDGWGRRRAIEALVRRDGIPPAVVGDFVSLLASPMNRTWVLATMVESGLVEADDPMIAGLAGTRAADRLRRRYAGEG